MKWLDQKIIVCTILLFIPCLSNASDWDKLSSSKLLEREKALLSLNQKSADVEQAYQIAIECIEIIKRKSDVQVVHYARVIYKNCIKTIIINKYTKNIPNVNKNQIIELAKANCEAENLLLFLYCLKPENSKIISKLNEELENTNNEFAINICLMSRRGVVVETWRDIDGPEHYYIHCMNFGQSFVAPGATEPTIAKEIEGGYKVSGPFYTKHEKYLYNIGYSNEYQIILVCGVPTNNLLERMHLIYTYEPKNRIKIISKNTWAYWVSRKKLLTQCEIATIRMLDKEENSKGCSKLFLLKDGRVVNDSYVQGVDIYEPQDLTHHDKLAIYLSKHGTLDAMPGLYAWAKRNKKPTNYGYIAMLCILQRHYSQKWIDILKKVDATYVENYEYVKVSTNAKVIEMLKKNIHIYRKYDMMPVQGVYGITFPSYVKIEHMWK